MVSQILLGSELHQAFRVTIPGDKSNLTLQMTLDWNVPARCWVLGIYNANTGDAVLLGLPLLPGYDLLSQHEYLGMGTAVLVNSEDQSVVVPDTTNLNTNFALTWDTTNEQRQHAVGCDLCSH